MLNNGDNLLKIIIGQGLKYDKNLLESTDKEIEFAKKYQLLSKNTALFGEILKDGSSPQSELIKVNINDERNKILMRPGRAIFSARGRVTNAFGRGGRMGGRVLMKTKAMPSAKMTKSIGSAKLALAKTTLAPRGAAKIEKNSAQKKTDYQKKPSFVQREDGSIGIMDEFNDMLVSQDFMEGFWDENKETKKLVDKVKKEKFDKIVQYVKNKNINQDFNKIVYTILVIYYIQKEKSKNINEFRLVLNKGKKYLISKGINYDEGIKTINI